MSVNLFFGATFKFLCGLVLAGLLLFLPAGTFNYPQAWIFIVILFAPMFLAGIVLMIKNPDLLRRRLNAKESESEQKTVLLLSGVMFIAAFTAAGLSFKFKFLILPHWVSYTAAVLFSGAYILYAEVLRENEYLFRTVRVQENQRVIDTGLYGIVRHPMYMSTMILFLSMPLILGSPISFLIMLFYIPIIAKRIKNEEEFLEKNLPGYTEYKTRVKYKVIPFIF